MSKHDIGIVRVIPAEPTHMYHQLNNFFKDRVIICPVETIPAPGRHRVESVPDNVATIFVTEQVNFNGPAFECVREWTDDMAIGFEYLPV